MAGGRGQEEDKRTKENRNLAKLARGVWGGVGPLCGWWECWLVAISIPSAYLHPCSAIHACQDIATTRPGYKIDQERVLCTHDGVSLSNLFFFFCKTVSRFILPPCYSPHRLSPLRQFLSLS